MPLTSSSQPSFERKPENTPEKMYISNRKIPRSEISTLLAFTHLDCEVLKGSAVNRFDLRRTETHFIDLVRPSTKLFCRTKINKM